MGFRGIIDRIGRAVDPAGPDVYDYDHHLGGYADEEHRRRACFSRHDTGLLAAAPAMTSGSTMMACPCSFNGKSVGVPYVRVRIPAGE